MIDADFGTWIAEDDIMHITLNKRDKGQTWASPILGQGQLDAYSTDLEQKRLMLQRFQEEVSFAFTLTIFSCVGIWMSIVLHVMMSLVYASQHPMLFWFDQFCFPSCSFSVWNFIMILFGSFFYPFISCHFIIYLWSHY